MRLWLAPTDTGKSTEPVRRIAHLTETEVISSDDIWSFVEAQFSIVAACLPTLAPLIRGGRDPRSIVYSIRSFLSVRSSYSPKGEDRSHASNAREWDDAKYAKHAWRKLHTSAASSNTNAVHNEGIALDDIGIQSRPADAIFVQKSYTNNVDTI